jgi:hypothetical protein
VREEEEEEEEKHEITIGMERE